MRTPQERIAAISRIRTIVNNNAKAKWTLPFLNRLIPSDVDEDSEGFRFAVMQFRQFRAEVTNTQVLSADDSSD